MVTALQILINTRSLLAEERHWCQGQFYDDATEAHCLMGAWEASGRDDPLESWIAYQILADLTNTDAAYHRRVHCWNDQPGRTHAEVLALLDRAIERAKLEQEPRVYPELAELAASLKLKQAA